MEVMTLLAYKVSPKTGELLWVRSSEREVPIGIDVTAGEWHTRLFYCIVMQSCRQKVCESLEPIQLKEAIAVIRACAKRYNNQTTYLHVCKHCSNCMRIRFYECKLLLATLQLKRPYEA